MFFRKKEKKIPTVHIEQLENGELPFGWIARNKAFVDDIQAKNKYFMNLWLNSRSGTKQEKIGALKSFINFLEEAKNISASKGECYLKWFQDIIADDNYINKRIAELNDLELHEPTKNR